MGARHLTDDELRRFARRLSAEQELWEADAHLRDCAECRERLQTAAPSAQRVQSLRRDLTGSPHLDFETQLVPYLDGTLRADARRDVETHLADCHVCRREVSDLQPLASSRRRAPARRRRLLASLAAAALLVLIVAAVLRMRKEQTPSMPTGGKPVAAVHETPAPALSLRDGDRDIVVDAAGALHGLALDAGTTARVAAALKDPELLPPAALSALGTAPGEIRGDEEKRDFALLSPVGTATVESRPRLTWRGPASRSYHVSVVEPSGLHWSGETTSTQWTPPDDLPRGRTYTWQVSTTIGGRRVFTPAPPQHEARFRVVDEATAAAIETARRDKGHLVAGLLSYDAGAIADARRELEQLAADNPGSPIPRKLIESCERALAHR